MSATYEPQTNERLVEIDLQLTVNTKLYSDNGLTNEQIEEGMSREAKQFALKYLTAEAGDPRYPFVLDSDLNVAVIVKDAKD